MGEDAAGRGARWGRLKAFVAVLIGAFAVTLGVVVGNRLSEEALGVLAGAVCGVGAAIPTSLIVVAVSRRQAGADSVGSVRVRERRSHEGRQPYPPVIVVSPANGQPSRSSWNTLPTSLSAPPERDFRVVGGTATDLEGVRYDDERCA